MTVVYGIASNYTHQSTPLQALRSFGEELLCMASKNLSLLHRFRSVLVGLNTVDGHLVEHLDATIDVILSRARM
jgi:hypothetical protein